MASKQHILGKMTHWACNIRSPVVWAIICMLLMLLLMTNVQNVEVVKDEHDIGSLYKMARTNPKGNTSAMNLDMHKDEGLKGLTEEDNIESLYKMAHTLWNTTKQRNLEALIGNLAVLRTRKFPKTQRPDVCNGCNTYNFKNIINPTHICRGQEDIMLFIIITTIPKEHLERAAVRKTWASPRVGVRHLFLFGGGFGVKDQEIIDKESNKYGDILQEDFLDNYYNLSYKTIMGYRWVTNNCPGAKYIMRAACDTFVYIPKVLRLLQKKDQIIGGQPMENAQIGVVCRSVPVLRIPTTKWFISENELNMKWRTFSDFCQGATFVFHRKAAIKFLKASADVPFFILEDVYYGMVIKTTDISLIHVPAFVRVSTAIGLPMNKGCPNKGQWYSVHDSTPDIIQQLWDSC